MHDGPLDRIAEEAGVDLVAMLANLQPTDLQSVLLEVHRRHAARRRPATLLETYARNRFVRPSPLDPRALTDFEQMAWSLLPQDYEPIELAPLCPLGTSSVVAAVDQNMAVAADRNVEVVSDSTNVLALEAALRRRIMLRDRDVRATAVRLVASQRQVRAQHYASPTAAAHFRLLALVAAGRSTASAAFECRAMVEQIGYLVSLLHEWRPGWAVEVAVSDFRGRTRLMESEVLTPLRELVPRAALRTDANRRAGRGYYVDLCYKLYVTTSTATRIEVGDGGCVDWTAKLLSDERERLVISGIGIERLLG